MPFASWRLVGRRSLADRMVVAVAWLVMVAAITLLAAGAMYADAVARAGLLRALGQAGPAATSIQVSALFAPDDAAAADTAVTGAIASALGSAGGEIARSGRSETYALPEQPAEGVRNLAVFGFVEGVESRTRLVEGAWPAAGAEPLQAALSRPAANVLAAGVGTELPLTSRLDSARSPTIRIVGIYEVVDAADPFWASDPLDLEGVSRGTTFTTHGPLLVTRDDFLARTIVHRADLRWRALPALDAIAAGDLAGIRSRVGALEGRLRTTLAAAESLDVATELPALLAGAGSSLLVSRAGVLLLNVQLAVLAGYALLLVGALIVEQRRAETALLRSRGASTLQLFRYALMEALLLVVPAAIAAPLLALGVLAVFERLGPLAGLGLSLRPVVTRDAILLGGIACVISLLALAVPGVAGLGPLAGVRRAVGRQFQATLPQRLGLDVALVILALIGLWQLQQYGAPLTRTLRGSLGVDPLLIAAPTIGLLAGAILALRILPLVARGLEDLLGRRDDMGPALGARQLARRPLRYTRAALLLMVASAVGIFAATYAATWARSQHDQVDYAVGADLRAVSANPQAPPWQVADAYTRLPGVEAALPVLREPFQLGRTGGRGELLAIDAAAAPSVTRFRPDLASVTAAELFGSLVAARPQTPLAALPGRPHRLAFDIDVDLRALRTDAQPADIPAGWTGIGMAAVVRDASGLVHRFTGPARAGNGSTTLEIPLDETPAEDGVAVPVAPLELVGAEISLRPPSSVALAGRISVVAARASDSAATDAWNDVPPEATAAWQAVRIDTVTGIPDEAGVPADEPRAVVISELEPLISTAEARYGLRPPDLPGDAERPVPALVNRAFLDATGLVAGDQIEIGEQFSITRRLVVTGEVRGFPTLDPAASIAVLDLPTLTLADYAGRSRLVQPLEWWLQAPSVEPAIADTLAAPPFFVTELNRRDSQLAARLGDPIALGVVGALALAAVAAWFFAALGFVVSAAVATRERLTEFALLRALGLSRRQLGLSLSLENAFLLLLSVTVGVGLGLLLAWVVLPSVTLTPEGTPPLPHVVVALPTDVLALLALFGAALLVLTLVVLRRLSEQGGLAALLRLREE